MAEDIVYSGYQYRLRAGSPMPVGSSGNFVLHTFMKEKYKVDSYLYTEKLPSSEDFIGQGGGLYSANFSRLSDKGGDSFQGRIVYAPTIIDEDST